MKVVRAAGLVLEFHRLEDPVAMFHNEQRMSVERPRVGLAETMSRFSVKFHTGPRGQSNYLDRLLTDVEKAHKDQGF